MLGWLSEFVFLHFGRQVVDTGVLLLYVLPVLTVRKTLNKFVKLKSQI